jgi:hypothetical protein
VHRELEEWLDEVWRKRDEIIRASLAGGVVKGRGAVLGEKNEGIWAVYDIYTGADSGGGVGTDVAAQVSRCERFLTLLEADIRTAPEIQHGNAFLHAPRGTMQEALRLGSVEVTDLKSKKPIKVTRRMVGKAFLHFRKSQIPCAHRIYVHTKPEHRGEVMWTALSVFKVWAVDGLSNAKVAGPDDDGRADSILFYLKDGKSRDEVLTRLKPYARTCRHHFDAKLPRLTEPVPGMTGFGTADEPPSLHIVKSGEGFYARREAQSFGFYRASLIFMALDRTKLARPGQSDADRCAAFKRRAEKYLRAGGVDPDRPALQGVPQAMLGWDALEARIGKLPETS